MQALRVWRVLPVIGLLVAGLAAPPPTAACSCAPPRPLAEYADEASAVIVVGWVGPQTPNGFAFRVERWYSGSSPMALLTMVPGDGASCGIGLRAGQHLIAVAFRDEQGLFHPSLCSPSAAVEGADGQALIAEAERAFGAGPVVPPQPPPNASEATTGLPWSLLAAVALGGMALGLGVVLRRGRQD